MPLGFDWEFAWVLQYLRPGGKILTGDAVRQAVQREVFDPKPLPGEDAFLNETILPPPSTSEMTDAHHFFLPNAFFLWTRFVHATDVHEAVGS